mgnify:FL=1
MIRFDNNLEELNNVDVEQLKAGTPTPQTYSADSRDIDRDQEIELPKVRVPQLIVENPEAIAQFTNLINDSKPLYLFPLENLTAFLPSKQIYGASTYHQKRKQTSQ